MNTEQEILPGLKYVHKSDHRDNTADKSQWTISEQEERSSFSLMYASKWIVENDKGWGLHIIDKTADYLGVGVNRARDLFIAKFVDGAHSNIWHGYPADYVANNQDKPDRRVLQEWGTVGYISFGKVRKVLKGQPCNL